MYAFATKLQLTEFWLLFYFRQYMENEKNIILYIMNLPPGTVEAVREYEKRFDKKLRIMLLRDSRVRPFKDMSEYEGLDLFEMCDFSKPTKLRETLLPYQDQFLAVTCRGENHLARFKEVIPNVPYLRTPMTESLTWASDKFEMRKRIKSYNPKLNPKYAVILKNSKPEREKIIEKIGFPMIIKPANLSGSLLVSICYHEEELEKTLRAAFLKVKKAYDTDDRLETPKIIAEEYMEGDMYSVDSYVNSRGTVYHCPLVRVKTAREIGRDDFYSYLATTPTALKPATIARAEQAAEDTIHALGLRSTITHTELMKIDDEWKIVEIGARMGGFRHLLHKLSCDINHALNDVMIRIPRKPEIPKKCKGFACAMKWFAQKEGIIIEMQGIKKLEQLDSFDRIIVNKKIGDRAVFARNGGRSVFNLFLYNDDRSKLLADIRRIEKLVKIKVATRGTVKKVAKKVPKKAVKKVAKKK